LEVFSSHEDLVDFEGAIEEIGADRANKESTDVKFCVASKDGRLKKSEHCQKIPQTQGKEE